MPRGSSRSSSGSSRGGSTSRVPPPTTTGNTQVGRPSMAGGLMGSMMSGMAFGAGSEFIRGLFRNPTTGGLMMPLILSGATAYGANRFLMKNVYKNKGIYTAAVFGGSFLIYKAMFSPSGQGYAEY